VDRKNGGIPPRWNKIAAVTRGNLIGSLDDADIDTCASSTRGVTPYTSV